MNVRRSLSEKFLNFSLLLRFFESQIQSLVAKMATKNVRKNSHIERYKSNFQGKFDFFAIFQSQISTYRRPRAALKKSLV